MKLKLFSLLFCSLPAFADITSNLLVHWAMDEGTGTFVDNTGSRGVTDDGTLTNGPTWETGKIGAYAVGFDGADDIVDTSDLALLASSTAFTVSIWCRSTDLSGGGMYNIKDFAEMNGRSSTTDAVFIFRIISSGGGSPNAYTFTIGGASFDTAQTADNSVVLNTWQHVVGTYDNSNIRIYLNGSLIQTTPRSGATGDASSSGNNLRIGGYDYGGGDARMFEGWMDDFRVYDRKLSDSDVCELYALGGSSCAGGGSRKRSGVF